MPPRPPYIRAPPALAFLHLAASKARITHLAGVDQRQQRQLQFAQLLAQHVQRVAHHAHHGAQHDAGLLAGRGQLRFGLLLLLLLLLAVPWHAERALRKARASWAVQSRRRMGAVVRAGARGRRQNDKRRCKGGAWLLLPDPGWSAAGWLPFALSESSSPSSQSLFGGTWVCPMIAEPTDVPNSNRGSLCHPLRAPRPPPTMACPPRAEPLLGPLAGRMMLPASLMDCCTPPDSTDSRFFTLPPGCGTTRHGRSATSHTAHGH